MEDHMGGERAGGFVGNGGKEGGASEFDIGCMVTQCVEDSLLEKKGFFFALCRCPSTTNQ